MTDTHNQSSEREAAMAALGEVAASLMPASAKIIGDYIGRLEAEADIAQRRISEETARADLAHKRMQQGFVEVCETSLLHVSKERDEIAAYAEQLREAARHYMETCPADPDTTEKFQAAGEALAATLAKGDPK